MATERKTERKTEQIARHLGRLAMAKNQTVQPPVIATYAEILEPYPLEAVQAAILAIAADDSAFFPPVGKIIGQAGQWLRGDHADTGPAPVLSPEGAWRLARTTIARYQPQTRPRPQSGNPAVDAALRDIGGVAACQWDDQVGEGIVKRAFLAHYERHAATPEHLRWALQGGPRETPVIPGVEVPQYEVERWSAEARATGRELPGPVAAAADGKPERATVLDGRAVVDPLALPAPVGPPLDPERRRSLSESVRAGIARLVDGMRMPR